MSHAQWVATRTPAPPARIVERVKGLLASHPELERVSLAEAMVAAAELLLAEVLEERRREARDAALDLLAADACVTWAFEAAAEAPETLGARAEEAMRRLATVAR